MLYYCDIHTNTVCVLSDLGPDFPVRLDRSWLAHHHPSPHFLPLQASDQSAQVVSCLGPIQRLVEHLDAWAEQDEWWGGYSASKRAKAAPLSCHSPVTTDLKARLWPTNSASSPFLIRPLSRVPVTTVPLPERHIDDPQINRKSLFTVGWALRLCFLWCLPYLGWSTPPRRAGGKASPALSWAEECRNPQRPAAGALRLSQARAVCSETGQKYPSILRLGLRSNLRKQHDTIHRISGFI